MEGADTAALEHWLSDLPETDLPVRGHLLASLAITNIRRAGGMAEVAIDALTVEQLSFFPLMILRAWARGSAAGTRSAPAGQTAQCHQRFLKRFLARR